MKGFLLFTALLVFIAGCAAPTAVPPTPPPTLAAPIVAPNTQTPQAVPSSPTTAPQSNLGETKTYHDAFAGFEFDYPASWNITPIAAAAKQDASRYAATFFSWNPTGGGSEGIPDGETKIDVGVIKNGATSAQDALEKRKLEFASGGLGQTILSQELWTLPSGIQAARLQVRDQFGDSMEMITALNGNTILFGGVGDSALFDAIARTLRPAAVTGNDSSHPDSTRVSVPEGKFSLELPKGWQVFGPERADNDVNRPLNMYVFGTDAATHGEPYASRVIIADASQWTVEEFAVAQCGTLCPKHPFEDETIGGKPAKKTIIGGAHVPWLVTWHFVTHNNKLLAFSIHDYKTLEPLDNVIQSIRFE